MSRSWAGWVIRIGGAWMAVLGLAGRLAAADSVHSRSGIVVHGRIVSFDAKGVRVQVSQGRLGHSVFIRADDIDRVQVELAAEQKEGEQLFERGRYRAAVEPLRAALARESRGWLRRRILTRLIASYLADGDTVAAVDAFLQAVGSSDGQVPWQAVPLCWQLAPCPIEPARQLASDLLRSDQPLALIIGASYLFGTDRAEQARGVLTRLSTYHDERVAQLARLQLWRWQAAEANADRLDSWEQAVSGVPPEFRAGPYFLIGLLRFRRGEYEAAAMALLWPAFVFRDHPAMSRQAHWLAAQALHRSGHPQEAKGLIEELLKRYPRSKEAREANRLLGQLGPAR